MSAPGFVDAMPHGDLKPIFPDIFFVTGTSRPKYQGVHYQFSRNMIVLRQDKSLTIVNTVRLNNDGLTQLDALGRVANVVKLGQFHGYDDPFYLDRYPGARQWALPGMNHDGGQTTDVELTADSLPVSDCSLFVFETAKMPEGLLILEGEGGIVISCDSLQNWVDVDPYFNPESAQMMRDFGFIQPANIGPGWRQSAQPQASDFERLRDLRFAHLLPAHGVPLLHDAHAQLSATFAREMGI